MSHTREIRRILAFLKAHFRNFGLTFQSNYFTVPRQMVEKSVRGLGLGMSSSQRKDNRAQTVWWQATLR